MFVSGTVSYRRASEDTVFKKKRSSLDVNVINQPQLQLQPPPQIVIPCIRTEQFTEISETIPNGRSTEALNSVNQVKSESSPMKKSEEFKRRPKDYWRSQAAFELSSSVESEASYIINEFLNRTKTTNDLKFESDV